MSTKNNKLAMKRILDEYKDLNHNDYGMTAKMDENDHTKWIVHFFGPTDTLYEDGVFKLSIEFTQQYPFEPPLCKFITKIFHPNINTSGVICLDLLKGNWIPSLSVAKLIMSIISLLTDPNPHSPLNGEAATLYLNHKDDYNLKTKEYTEKYAII
jgi:ubiquitin-conjugating enzyme E2 D/E